MRKSTPRGPLLFSSAALTLLAMLAFSGCDDSSSDLDQADSGSGQTLEDVAGSDTSGSDVSGSDVARLDAASTDTTGSDTPTNEDSTDTGADTATNDALITNVRASSDADYQITTLSVGLEQYIDRDYTFLRVPSTYEGTAYIQTANDDKTASDDVFLTFDLARQATVAVLFDNRLPRPTWLSDSNGWVDTGVDAKAESANSPQFSRIYEKSFAAGNIQLPGNGSTDNGSSMYAVAATEGDGLGARDPDPDPDPDPSSGDEDSPVSTPTSNANLLVLTDMSSIEAGVREPDDAQTMVRLMLYSNEFNIKGLVASSSLRHGQTTHPEYINTIIDKYGQVRANLLQHDSDYPTESSLHNVVKSGQSHADEDVPVFDSIGQGKNTEGSEWIIQTVDNASANDPIWIAIWGGPADLAQALWKVRETRSSQGLDDFVAKIRVITSGDQDSTGPWIKSNFADLYYITGGSQGRGYFREGDMSLVSSQWVQQNIRGHGALGDFYPDYDGGGRFGPIRGVKSGDSHAIIGLTRNGLNLRDHLTWSNWGGQRRQANGDPNRYEDATADVSTSNLSRKLKPVWRWRPAFQHDYQARLDWCIQSYDSANHNPVRADAELNERDVIAGDDVVLHAGAWSDPDGDQLDYHWTVMPEESNYSGNVDIQNSHSESSAHFTAPSVSNTDTVHLLLTVTDDGNPTLSTYRRFLFHVSPD